MRCRTLRWRNVEARSLEQRLTNNENKGIEKLNLSSPELQVFLDTI
jgi:hypothetical protein